MPLLSNIVSRAVRWALPGVEQRSSTSDFLSGLDLLGLGERTTAGIRVDDHSALQLSAVYGSVRILSDGVSTLPVSVTRGKGSQSEAVKVGPAWLDRPNPMLEMPDLLSQAMTSLLLRGNAYLFTLRDADYRVTELHVLDPDTIKVDVTAGRKTLTVTTAQGVTVLVPGDFVHIPGMMLPGAKVGVSPIDYARETIALGLAAQDMGAAFFGNGAMPGAVIEVADDISDAGIALLRRGFNAMHQGAANSHKLAILTEGATFKPITVSPEQAQFLQTRAFQVADIARFFGVPPHLLADASGSTSWGSGLAEQDRAYVIHSLRPWVVRIEAHLSRLAQSERPTQVGAKKLYVELSVQGLLRGDWATRMGTYVVALSSGIYSLNEVRAFEGLPPIGPDGDEHKTPASAPPVAPAPVAPEPMPAADPDEGAQEEQEA